MNLAIFCSNLMSNLCLKCKEIYICQAIEKWKKWSHWANKDSRNELFCGQISRICESFQNFGERCINFSNPIHQSINRKIRETFFFLNTRYAIFESKCDYASKLINQSQNESVYMFHYMLLNNSHMDFFYWFNERNMLTTHSFALSGAYIQKLYPRLDFFNLICHEINIQIACLQIQVVIFIAWIRVTLASIKRKVSSVSRTIRAAVAANKNNNCIHFFWICEKWIKYGQFRWKYH